MSSITLGETAANKYVNSPPLLMSDTETETPEQDDRPPAPDTDILVRDGGNGDVFLRFGAEQDNRRVELLNENDARDLYDKLGDTEAIQNGE